MTETELYEKIVQLKAQLASALERQEAALAELLALREVVAAVIAWRALDLRILHMQMADGEQVQVQTDWTLAELRLEKALAALAVTQGAATAAKEAHIGRHPNPRP